MSTVDDMLGDDITDIRDKVNGFKDAVEKEQEMFDRTSALLQYCEENGLDINDMANWDTHQCI